MVKTRALPRDRLRSKERKTTRFFTTRESLRSFERSPEGALHCGL